VDGALTKSTHLLQAQADLLQVPVAAYPGAYATAQGAASLARLALDRTATLEREISAGAAQTKPVRPKWSADQAADYRARWREAASRLHPAPALSAAS
jgi:glycerol kinase